MTPDPNPLITIITPAFNAAGTIGATLQSVAGQDYDRIEHIIVDGLSQDKTPEIVEQYRQKYPHLQMIRERDKGVYDAMNKGIRASRGQYLYFMGSDDTFVDNRVLSDLVRSGLLNETTVVYGNVQISGDTGWAKDGQIYDGPFTMKKLTHQNICHQAIFYPKKLLLKTGTYNIDYRINADWDLNMRCWARGEFRYFDRIISVFSAGGTSTNTTDVAFRRDYMRVIMRCFGYSCSQAVEFGKFSPWGDLTGEPENQNIVKKAAMRGFFRILLHKLKNLSG